MRQLLLSICFVALWSSFEAQAQTKPQSNMDLSAFSTAKSWTWTTATWSPNDQTFQRAYQQVNARLASSSNKAKVVLVYKKLWQKQKTQPIAFFRYAQSAYTTLPTEQNALYRQLQLLSADFDSLPSPRSYAYSRLRFLIEVRQSARPQLKPLAKRLLQRNPKDADVIYYSINLWNLTNSEERKYASSSVRTLVQLDSKRASSYAAAGWIHLRIWNVAHSQQEAQQATHVYQKYLQLAPKNDPFRPQAQRIIAMMQKQ